MAVPQSLFLVLGLLYSFPRHFDIMHQQRLCLMCGPEFFVIWKLLARLCLICGPRTIRRVVLVMDPELSAILTSLARLCLICGSIEPTFILMPLLYLGNSVSHNTVDTVDVRYSYGGAGTSGFTCFLVDRHLKKNSKS